jgi:hypothetical protein
MENNLKPSTWSRHLLRELAGIGLPALLAAVLFAALPADSRSQGDRAQAPKKTEAAPLCDEWHRGSGATAPLDLDVVKQAYADLKTRVAKSLGGATAVAPPDLPDKNRSYDTGLPACRGEATRTQALPAALTSRFPGKLLYFISASDLGRLRLPPEIEHSQAAEILVVRASHLADLPEIARRLGRPVSLGTAEFAKALGIRCANTWLRISEKGEGSELHESP